MHGVPRERVYEGGGITEHTTQGEGVSSLRRFLPQDARHHLPSGSLAQELRMQCPAFIHPPIQQGFLNGLLCARTWLRGAIILIQVEITRAWE